MKKIIAILVLGLALYAAFEYESNSPSRIDSDVDLSEQSIETVFKRRASNVQVQGDGIVIRLLEDDNDGSRHQRFIVELPSERTILIAHNIDLAPRIDALRVGDAVRFFGEYEWNPQGGVVHWTHHDPAGRHAGGWIQHEGKRYE